MLSRARAYLRADSRMCCTPSRNGKRHLPRRATRLTCVAALARTREGRQNCVRFAYRGPQVDRLHVLELERNVK